MDQIPRSRRKSLFWTALFGLAAAAAHAQEQPITTQKERPETLRITLSGGVRMDYVTRSREITGFTNSVSNPTHDPLLASFPNPATSDSENTFEGEVYIRTSMELESKISAVFEFGTRRFDQSVNGERIIRWGEGGQAVPIQLREAHVKLSDVLTPGLSVEAGISTWSFNPRGKGGSLAFDPRRSRSVHQNLHGVFAINGGEAIDARLGNAGFPLELLPVGGVVTYGAEPFIVEVVILPATVEFGKPTQDESIYATDFYYDLPALGPGSRVGLIVALNPVATDPPGAPPGIPPSEHGRLWTVGGGGTVKLLDGALELHGEGYVQFGKTGETAASENVDAAGRALRAGLEWKHTVGNPMPIWAGFNITYLSGDDDTDPNDRKTDRFAAYGNVIDLMILEDPYYGFDWDSNYKAIKAYAGAALSIFEGKDNLELTVTAGITRAAKEVGTGPAAEDKLGNEVDLRGRWHINKQTTLALSAAYLSGSKILEAAMEVPGGPGSNPQASDSAYLLVLGVDLEF